MNSDLKKIIFSIVWIALFLGILFDLDIRNRLLVSLTNHPVLAPFALVASQVLLASFVLPCSPLTALAGILWGFEFGIFYSTIATIISSLWTFFLARYVFREWVLKKIRDNNWCLRILRLIDAYRWKASMIAHANPVFPGASLGYAFGLSNVSVRSFAFGALVGTLPLQLMMVGIGYLMGRATTNDFDIWLVLVVFGLAIAFIIYSLVIPRF